jgi:uncharacterized protein (TIGR02118 family)
MIKVSAMYPSNAGARFNHDYYRDKHMPLIKARLGDTCKYYTVDKGLAGGAPGAPATYVPAAKLWGAQTQRSLEQFSIGQDLVPRDDRCLRDRKACGRQLLHKMAVGSIYRGDTKRP